MTRPQVRFRPPQLEIGPAAAWMLRRAFAPPVASLPAASAAAASAAAAGAAVAVCRRFELSERVAARQGRLRLTAELGPAAADLLHDRALAVAGSLRLAMLAERVAATAAGLGLPVAFLKFAALEMRGLLLPGSRSACDLDVLAPAGRAAELQQALIAAGFTASRLAPQEHQLATLASPDGIVEVHRVVLGVRVRGRRSATLDELERAGLLTALPGLPGRAALPVPAVAAAHALVHGIAQHGWSPIAYSLLKMIADLVDLGLAGPEGEALAARAAGWVATDVAAGEVEAARRLAAALAAGEDLPGWGASPAAPALLLRHALAGRLDERYERSLRLSQFRRQPSDRPAAVRLAGALAATVWLSRARVDAIYGPPRHRLGYLGRQLGRPLDLLARLGRYGLNAWRVRQGRAT
jgi:Uncharacterised nucleotidyltransferase